MMPQTCLLNMSVARLGKLWPSGIVHICSRAIFTSLPELVHFLNVCFIIWYRLWPVHYFDGGMMMILLALHWLSCRTAETYQKQSLCQHLTLFSGVYHIQWILFLWCWWGSLLTIPQISWWWKISCCNLQQINSFCYWNGIHLHQLLPTAWVVCHDELTFPLAVSAEIQDM